MSLFTYRNILAGGYTLFFLFLTAYLLRKAFAREPWEGPETKPQGSNLGVDLALFFFLAIASIKFTTSLVAVREIALFDEGVYLYHGISLGKFGLPEIQKEILCAPLYSAWYYMLSLFKNDPIQLYYLNIKILVSFTTLGLYVYLRRLNVMPLIAAAASFLYLVSANNSLGSLVIIWVQHFALLVLLLFLILSTFVKSREDYYGLVGYAMLLISFARPEYFLSFIIFFLLFLIFYLRKFLTGSMKKAPGLFKISSFLLFTSALFYIFGNPIYARRGLLAFIQHFAINYVRWNDLSIHPWTNSLEIAKSVFGDTQSMIGIVTGNSRMFFRHILSNAAGYIPNFIDGVLIRLRGRPWLMPDLFIRSSEAVFFLAGFVFLYKKRLEIRKVADKNKAGRLYALIAVLSVPVLLMAVLIYPRSRYMIMQQTMILGLLSYFVSSVIAHSAGRRGMNLFTAIVLGIVFLVLTPDMARYRQPVPERRRVLPARTTVEFIRSLGIKSEVMLLEYDWGYRFYLGDNYDWPGMWLGYPQPEQPFREYITSEGINMIVVSKELKQCARFVNDSGFKAFLRNPQALGFKKLQVPNIERYILIKPELLR